MSSSETGARAPYGRRVPAGFNPADMTENLAVAPPPGWSGRDDQPDIPGRRTIRICVDDPIFGVVVLGEASWDEGTDDAEGGEDWALTAAAGDPGESGGHDVGAGDDRSSDEPDPTNSLHRLLSENYRAGNQAWAGADLGLQESSQYALDMIGDGWLQDYQWLLTVDYAQVARDVRHVLGGSGQVQALNIVAGAPGQPSARLENSANVPYPSDSSSAYDLIMQRRRADMAEAAAAARREGTLGLSGTAARSADAASRPDETPGSAPDGLPYPSGAAAGTLFPGSGPGNPGNAKVTPDTAAAILRNLTEGIPPWRPERGKNGVAWFVTTGTPYIGRDEGKTVRFDVNVSNQSGKPPLRFREADLVAIRDSFLPATRALVEKQLRQSKKLDDTQPLSRKMRKDIENARRC